ncbi:MAG: hypothetical protein CVU86_06430 [Firmicutes bacterium HGW-Firmicutes-11]|jgi:hypothetical protein|nr:MAG: hypothetical protein CVU86_06430 [Firmicutes bacterium HGW-Firmicutes-11]
MRQTLYEIDTEECTITTFEGHAYLIDPSYVSAICTWIPTTELEVEKRNEAIIITQTSTGTEVNALLELY